MESKTLVMEEPGVLSHEAVTVPQPTGEEVLLKVALCGVCGSDVHMNEGGMDLNFPVRPGHEFAGVIEATGDELEVDSSGKPVATGDSVTVVPGVVCGECWYCKNVPARPTTCENRDVYGFLNADYRQQLHGGFSEYVLVEEDTEFYKLPEGLDTDLGALTEPLAVATRAFERGFAAGMPDAREGFGIGKSVAVQGAGPIGLLTLSAARAGGAGQIIALDVIDERLELAEDFGATDVVNIGEYEDDEALIEAVQARTNGNVGADVVIEAAGIPSAVTQGIEMVRDGGSFVEAGHYAYNGEVDVNPTRIVQKDLDIFGSLAYPPNQFETALSLLDQLQDDVPFDALFNYEATLSEAESAYERQASGEAYRATVRP